MLTDAELLKRISELSERAFSRGIYQNSDFLTESEQAQIKKLSLPLFPRFEGGFPDAERRIAFFGSAELFSYEEPPPVVCVEISPLSQKFADELTHRDFLGSLMALGIDRRVLGDILVCGNKGYLFCLDRIAPFIVSELTSVRRTTVSCRITDALPESVGVSFRAIEVIAPSPRLDALVSAVFDLSRAEGKELVDSEKVSVSGCPALSPSRELSPGEKVSVRGLGKFLFDGPCGETRRGRIRFSVRLFV